MGAGAGGCVYIDCSNYNARALQLTCLLPGDLISRQDLSCPMLWIIINFIASDFCSIMLYDPSALPRIIVVH